MGGWWLLSSLEDDDDNDGAILKGRGQRSVGSPNEFPLNFCFKMSRMRPFWKTEYARSTLKWVSFMFKIWNARESGVSRVQQLGCRYGEDGDGSSGWREIDALGKTKSAGKLSRSDSSILTFAIWIQVLNVEGITSIRSQSDRQWSVRACVCALTYNIRTDERKSFLHLDDYHIQSCHSKCFSAVPNNKQQSWARACSFVLISAPSQLFSISLSFVAVKVLRDL